MTRKNLSSKSKIGIASICILLPLSVLLFSGLQINSNILDLVPDSGHSEQSETAVRHFTENISSNSLFLIKSKNETSAFQAAETFEDKLRESSLFKEIHGKKSESEYKLWYELYFPHRFHLLTEESRELLASGQKEKFLKNRVKKLYSTQSSLYSANLEKDPLMLFGDFVQELPSPGSFSLKNGFLFKESNQHKLIFISALFKDSVFSSSVQKKFRSLLNRFLKEHEDIELLQLGFFPYAEKARSDAEWEISIIGSGSIIGIILLFLLVFKSVKQLALTLAAITGAICFGAATTALLFKEIHIITIVFGATLTGVCVDFAFHWFSHLKFGIYREESHVKKGILWGAATSITAYSALFLSGFPGLKQIAVFSCSGILFSLLLVIFLFPAHSRRSPAAKVVLKSFSSGIINKSASIAVFCLILISSAAGLFFISSNDDIRLLQNRPEDLLKQEAEFRSSLSPFDSSRFILVNAENEEELLSKEKLITASLQESKALENSLSLSSMLPPLINQQADFILLHQVVHSEEFKNYCNELGFKNDTVTETEKMLFQSQALTLKNFIEHPAANQVKALFLDRQTPSSIILLQNIKDEKKLRALLPEGAVYIDKVNDTSKVLGKFRKKALLLTFIAYGVILVVLCSVFGLKKGLRIILPPLLAVFITCGLWSLFGGSFNLFNILALVLVLGIGIDYSIFYSFSGKNPATETAVCLSTVSTLLAFGLLALSSTPALSSFGITLAMGIIFSYLAAPLAAAGETKESPRKSHSHK